MSNLWRSLPHVSCQVFHKSCHITSWISLMSSFFKLITNLCTIVVKNNLTVVFEWSTGWCTLYIFTVKLNFKGFSCGENSPSTHPPPVENVGKVNEDKLSYQHLVMLKALTIQNNRQHWLNQLHSFVCQCLICPPHAFAVTWFCTSATQTIVLTWNTPMIYDNCHISITRWEHSQAPTHTLYSMKRL